MSDKDAVVCSFHNSLLRKSDLEILENSLWFNDSLIGFFFEYFENVLCENQSDTVGFLCPGVTQLIKSCSSEGEVAIFVEPLSLNTKDFLFLPINDSTSNQSAGGTHWSLLLYQRSFNAFYHYDSLGGSNIEHARKVAKMLTACLQTSSAATFHTPNCLQQINGYDCGLHVIMNAEALVKHFVLKEALHLYDTFDSKEKRAHLKRIIQTVQ